MIRGSKHKNLNKTSPSAPISPPHSIKTPTQAPTPSIMSSIVTGFGHGIGMSMGSNMVNSIMASSVPKVIDNCSDIKFDLDRCFKNIDSEDCYDIIHKYKDCLNKKG
jgi:hypothetical protein